MKITGKELKEWNVPAGPVYKILLDKISDLELHYKQAQKTVRSLVKKPESYLDDMEWGDIAKLLMPKEDKIIKLNEKGCPVKIYGKHMIEQGALDQIDIASKLPVSVKAVLVPDAHQGYGLPIGGILATENNIIIPYAVGCDIACRMKLSVTDINAKDIEGMRDKLRNVLTDNTFFGVGCKQDGKNDDDVMYDERFNIISVKKLKDKAMEALATSGSGNHFCSYGVVKLDGIDGEWLGILSHSGSRGLGYSIASYYTSIAMDKCKLPKEAKHLAWLSLDKEEGQEYWEVMNLAGDYAKANHNIIHNRIIKGLGADLKLEYENHHNFAWKSKIMIDGDEKDVIIHRKGSTPAGKGVIGLIPSSLSTMAYIVEGLGNEESLCSSSHGTGRTMSRQKAKETFTMSDMKKDLESKGIELIGGGLDECKDCYKPIEDVMNEQSALVKIIGSFMPWMVRMAVAEKRRGKKRKRQDYENKTM